MAKEAGFQVADNRGRTQAIRKFFLFLGFPLKKEGTVLFSEVNLFMQMIKLIIADISGVTFVHHTYKNISRQKWQILKRRIGKSGASQLILMYFFLKLCVRFWQRWALTICFCFFSAQKTSICKRGFVEGCTRTR